MSIKIVVYILTTILNIYLIDSLNINNMFKKNRIVEARIVILIISISVSYLVTNYIYDFIEYTSF